MRDHRFDSQSFCFELERQINSSLKFSTEVLSRITPSALGSSFENSYRIKDRSLVNLILLSLISWYIPEEIGILLRFSIIENISNQEDLEFLNLLLDSKGEMKLFLINTTLWHTRDFFGNILVEKNLQHALNSIVPSLKSNRKPKRVQRHRGYRDKGTLRKESDKHDFWISTDEQNRLENERKSRQETLDLLRGFIGSGG